MVADFLNEVLGNGVENYLDEILISTKDFDKPVALIEVVLARVQSAGLSVNSPKSRWGCVSLILFRMMVDRQGVRPAESKPQR